MMVGPGIMRQQRAIEREQDQDANAMDKQEGKLRLLVGPSGAGMPVTT